MEGHTQSEGISAFLQRKLTKLILPLLPFSMVNMKYPENTAVFSKAATYVPSPELLQGLQFLFYPAPRKQGCGGVGVVHLDTLFKIPINLEWKK